MPEPVPEASRYYEGHELVYQRLLAQGCRAWDEYLGQADDFRSFCLRPFVAEAVSRSTFAVDHPRALEVGCGTGPVCCYLAEAGFRVEGIDISPTAIAMAENESQRQGLEISYRVADVCGGGLRRAGQENVDVVVDGHCLHCIVLRRDRELALAAIRDAIRPGGYFWMETMLGDSRSEFGPDSILDEAGVLWVRISRQGSYDVERQFDLGTYVASRRIHRDPDLFRAELRDAGFTIVWEEVRAPAGAGKVGDYRVVCTRT